MKRYEIEFYVDKKGYSPVLNWINVLNSNPNKSSISMLKKLYYQLERLEYEGTFLGEPHVKHIEGKLWELKPLPNRVLFANLDDYKIILLHHFRKTTNKTPKREIEQAKRELADWNERMKG